MAQSSKRKQQLRQAKRRATRAERAMEIVGNWPKVEQELRRLSDENTRVKVMLFAILAQGGPREVTKGTIDQVSETFSRLSVTSSAKRDEPTTFILTLVEAPKPEEQTAEPPVVEERPRLDPLDGMRADETSDVVQSGAEDIGKDQLQASV